MFCGIFTSFLIPETKRKTLEQLAGEVEGTPEYDPDNMVSTKKQMSADSTMEMTDVIRPDKQV